MGPTQGTGWDRDVHRRLSRGDEDALGEIYDRWAPLVYGLSLRIVGDARAAEDITQDVFLHLWDRPHTYDPDRGTLRGWLGAIAHHKAVDQIRRETRSRDPRVTVPAPAEPPDVEEQVVAADAAGRVRRAVGALPAAQREAITLAYWHGLTYREVARRLGIPEGTAKSRLRLGLRRLADALVDEGISR